MGALLNTDIQLEKEEIEFLNTIMDVDKWRENYDSYTGSPILFNEDYHGKILGTEDGNKRFNEIFMKYVFKSLLFWWICGIVRLVNSKKNLGVLI